MGKTHYVNEELAFLASAIKEGRTSRRPVTLDAVGIGSWQSTVTKLVQFLPDVGFVTSLKNMTRRTPTNCVLSNPLISSSSNTAYRRMTKIGNEQNSG